MSNFEIYSKRQKRLRGETPDVYVYDSLPEPLRVQIIQIWDDVMGNLDQYLEFNHVVRDRYDIIVKKLRHEYGVIYLPNSTDLQPSDSYEELFRFFHEQSDVDMALDAVELTFRALGTRQGNSKSFLIIPKREIDAAIEDLNFRFKEHGVGFEFRERIIMRIDSQFIHSETVKPALELLNQNLYSGAQQEFLRAHEHFRRGNSKEAISLCLNSIESVMKAICDKRKWNYDKRATANSLIKICFDNELIPKIWQNHYSSLINVLKSGVPVGRNELSGHGQGSTPIVVPNHIMAYMLHMTATTIVFLADSEKNLP